MNGNDDGGRGLRGRSRFRRVGALAAAAGLALLAAACGGGGSSAAAGTTAYQKAVAYAQCMRSHGAPNWPDPNSKGMFIQSPANRADFQAPASADKACRHLLPNGGQMTAAQQQQALKQALKFSACMRAHGLPNFPDPTAAHGGVVVNLHGSGLSPDSPQFRAAQQACRKLLPGGGGS
jgi:hypothetical protein